MICCDTCPYSPTCEERDEFRREVLGLDEDEIAGEFYDGPG